MRVKASRSFGAVTGNVYISNLGFFEDVLFCFVSNRQGNFRGSVTYGGDGGLFKLLKNKYEVYSNYSRISMKFIQTTQE